MLATDEWDSHNFPSGHEASTLGARGPPAVGRGREGASLWAWIRPQTTSWLATAHVSRLHESCGLMRTVKDPVGKT